MLPPDLLAFDQPLTLRCPGWLIDQRFQDSFHELVIKPSGRCGPLAGVVKKEEKTAVVEYR